MKDSNEDIALIELGNGHQECLYSQMLFLKSAGYRIHLIITEKLFPQVSYDAVWDKLYLHKISASGNFRELIAISKYIKENKINTLIFNTAENAVVRNLVLLTGKKKCIGVLHNILKLRSSNTQKCISRRIKKYFVLNDYLIQPEVIPKAIQIQSMYPVFFPKFEIKDLRGNSRNEIWITIPGQLELKRRDYEGLIRILQKGISSKIKFILLGNASLGEGKNIISLIQQYNLGDHFRLFHEYVPEPEFHAYIKNSDIIMPLIHPVNEWQRNYRRKNISGTINFAFAYEKPLLMHDYFSGIEDFDNSSIYYTDVDLLMILQKIADRPEILAEISLKMHKNPKFSFEYQSGKYLEFVANSGEK